MSFLEDDEDIIFQTKKTKEILEMIEYVTNKFYEKLKIKANDFRHSFNENNNT